MKYVQTHFGRKIYVHSKFSCVRSFYDLCVGSRAQFRRHSAPRYRPNYDLLGLHGQTVGYNTSKVSKDIIVIIIIIIRLKWHRKFKNAVTLNYSRN